MKKADIYIKTDSTSPKMIERWYGYVLECKIADETFTREEFAELDGTYHQTVLTALTKALERFKEPCEISIHTEDVFVLNMLDHNLQIWAENGFLTTKGKALANQDEWKKVWQQSQTHRFKSVAGEHEYSEWMLSEINRRKEMKECE